MFISYPFFRVTWGHKGLDIAIELFWLDKEWIMWLNIGWSVELGLNLALDTQNLNLGLDALELQRHSWDWKPKEKATWQKKLLSLRKINRLLFLGLLLYM